MPREFTYRGRALEELQAMSLEEFADLLPSRERRTIKRGLPPRQKKLLERVQKVREEGNSESAFIRTHCRDMVVLPEMVGLKFGVYDGSDFKRIEVEPEMIGHRLGEFALTRKKVTHSTPGIGATRSSLYIPLK
ncbi:30S ribosomal protein S19 [candidate division MSBL1 archaeon SCGC-AAA261D19]|uniref:Small ribosomal subunit protein uS19 n=4 Tax=candidate division MSBL1 TaxID=215777 RepID=A0A133VSC4_9EURY|nr:30S ribosomal protein S19 [candidate division MSBL1 archaeon SCGC-AAA261D19]KXB04200.1 30S ribosomal protein S19 [candidate division MSBL1 archaeon SCGC-AAA261G05]KXB09359.1 30S ribosomal protein S19 [candidate division MSBL1 archaeon SCGC-AAA833K04]